MDMNVIIDLTTLQAKSDYSSTFEPALQTANAECTVFDFNALGINIETLRKKWVVTAVMKMKMRKIKVNMLGSGG